MSNNSNDQITQITRRRRALGLVVATAVATTPALGCASGPRAASDPSAVGTSAADATPSTVAMAADIGSASDTGPERDAEDVDIYPSGVRG